MVVSLKILSGPRAGATFAIPEGGVVRFGRTNQSDCAIPEDTFLSGQHFAVGCSKGRVMVSDLGSTNGTLVNGFRIRQPQALKDKDRVTAGHSTFLVVVEEETSRSAPAAASSATVAATDEKAPFRGPLSPLEAALVAYLGKQEEPVYALLDAARDDFVVPVLQAFAEEYRSLYEGASAEKLADCAPYLVRVKRDTRIIEELSHGWGKGWGIYLTCAASLEEIRKHLRQFLMVKTEEGKSLYFRYYDPSVIRVFLPTCTREETHAIFGPVGCYLAEAEDPEKLLRFKRGPAGVEEEIISLTPPKKP